MLSASYVFTYLPTRCFCIRNRTGERSERVRFLIQKQLVCKYRTPALSMKCSLFMNGVKGWTYQSIQLVESHGVLYETGVFSNSKSKKDLSILTRPLTKLSSSIAEILYTAKETI